MWWSYVSSNSHPYIASTTVDSLSAGFCTSKTVVLYHVKHKYLYFNPEPICIQKKCNDILWRLDPVVLHCISKIQCRFYQWLWAFPEITFPRGFFLYSFLYVNISVLIRCNKIHTFWVHIVNFLKECWLFHRNSREKKKPNFVKSKQGRKNGGYVLSLDSDSYN